jgi:YtcA family
MFDLKFHPPRRAALTAVAVLVCSAGCTGAPAHDILGSYFPSWMICALLGLILAIVVRQLLVATGVDDALPAPVLVYLALAVAFAFALWLLWLS